MQMQFCESTVMFISKLQVKHQNVKHMPMFKSTVNADATRKWTFQCRFQSDGRTLQCILLEPYIEIPIVSTQLLHSIHQINKGKWHQFRSGGCLWRGWKLDQMQITCIQKQSVIERSDGCFNDQRRKRNAHLPSTIHNRAFLTHRCGRHRCGKCCDNCAEKEKTNKFFHFQNVVPCGVFCDRNGCNTAIPAIISLYI